MPGNHTHQELLKYRCVEVSPSFNFALTALPSKNLVCLMKISRYTVYQSVTTDSSIYIASSISIHAFIFTVKLSPSDKPYLNALYDAAYSGKTKWLGIGNYLGLSESDLDGIQINNHWNVGDCFHAMLLKWLRSPNCYLDTFLSALESKPRRSIGHLCSKVSTTIL